MRFRCAGMWKRYASPVVVGYYGIDYVSTGEVIRGHIARGSELGGGSMESCIAQGKYAPVNGAGTMWAVFARIVEVTDAPE